MNKNEKFFKKNLFLILIILLFIYFVFKDKYPESSLLLFFIAGLVISYNFFITLKDIVKKTKKRKLSTKDKIELILRGNISLPVVLLFLLFLASIISFLFKIDLFYLLFGIFLYLLGIFNK